ncbi:sensor histidine kinase [Natrinema ejinorense]|uniref:sensor histidine kinase n=1 Tax=Natrinema ejinorense TaxID=373386 RepID=UPI001B806563|nr:sensor histidine kinase [Natrinema ejinorense]
MIEATDGGFAIVFEVVEAHGWRITVSESDAGGLRFEISTADEDGSVVTVTPVQDRQ